MLKKRFVNDWFDWATLFRDVMVYYVIRDLNKMNRLYYILLWVLMMCLSSVSAFGSGEDIRGVWVGNAKGNIFGAEGSVNITYQNGEDISGVVEGGNFFGRAKFSIQGKIRGNYIFGSKDGHTFEGFLYPDWSIQGLFRAIDGDTYKVILRRPYPSYWGSPYGTWGYN